MERIPVTLQVPQERKEVRGGTLNIYKKLYQAPIKRFYSTNEYEVLKDAILTLIMSDCGFSIKMDTLFDPDAKSQEESTLEIKRTGYGYSYLGPRDFWYLIRNGKEVLVTDNPHEIVDEFFRLVERHNLGQHNATI